MTATPCAPGRTAFQIRDADKERQHLGNRIFAPKPTRLVLSKNRPKDLDKLAQSLCEEALELGKGNGVRRVAVMVNRVATARKVYRLLSDGGYRADLLIGRMRPLDREALVEEME